MLAVGHYGFVEESRAFQILLTTDIAGRFELVPTSSFGPHATDVKKNSPRRARRMEFKKLSNRVKRVKTGLRMNFNVTLRGVANRTGYYMPQVLFVSFVLKESCASQVCCASPFGYPLKTTKSHSRALSDSDRARRHGPENGRHPTRSSCFG